MEIVNSYDETINYYISKISYASDEFDNASREMRKAKNDCEAYWISQAGTAYADKIAEIDEEFSQVKESASDVSGNLRALKGIIEEKIQKLIEEAKAAEEAAAAQAEAMAIAEALEQR